MRKELCVKMTTRGKMLLNLVDKSFEQDRPSLNEGLVTSKSDEVVVVSEPNLPLPTVLIKEQNGFSNYIYQ